MLGKDEDGGSQRLKIIGDALARAGGGQVIGRSAKEADYVIDGERVSRAHLRIWIEDDQLMVEDISTYEDTAINGRQVEKGKPEILRSGDKIRIATITMQVIIDT